MTENLTDQFRIPASPATPGEVFGTYNLSKDITAEQALELALVAAGETPQTLDTNNIDHARTEQFGAATISSLNIPTAEKVEVYYNPTNPADLLKAGEGVMAMRNAQIAA